MTTPPMSAITQPDQELTAPEPGQPASIDPAWLANILMMAAVLLLVIVVLGKMRRRVRTQAAEPQLDPSERLAALRARAEAEGGLEGRSAAAAERVRELTAILDTRIEHLDILIQQADERISRLDELASGPEQVRAPHRIADRSPAAGANGPSGKEDIYALADQGLTASEIAARLGQHAGKVELILALRRA